MKCTGFDCSVHHGCHPVIGGLALLSAQVWLSSPCLAWGVFTGINFTGWWNYARNRLGIVSHECIFLTLHSEYFFLSEKWLETLFDPFHTTSYITCDWVGWRVGHNWSECDKWILTIDKLHHVSLPPSIHNWVGGRVGPNLSECDHWNRPLQLQSLWKLSILRYETALNIFWCIFVHNKLYFLLICLGKWIFISKKPRLGPVCAGLWWPLSSDLITELSWAKHLNPVSLYCSPLSVICKQKTFKQCTICFLKHFSFLFYKCTLVVTMILVNQLYVETWGDGNWKQAEMKILFHIHSALCGANFKTWDNCKMSHYCLLILYIRVKHYLLWVIKICISSYDDMIMLSRIFYPL